MLIANVEVITLEDCLELMNKKDTYTVINDGKIVDFVGKLYE